MKKILIATLILGAISLSAKAAPMLTNDQATMQQGGTPVMDAAVLNKLTEIQANLLKSQSNPLNCTDGDKSYSPGMKISTPNQKYRCVVVDGHGEWSELSAFQ